MMTDSEQYFMLSYAEAIFSQMETPYKTQIRKSLDECWIFLETKNKTGEELYTLLDDGTDFNGIFVYMQLDENEDNILSWDNISYAIASTAKAAYSHDKQQLPSPLENIDSNLLDLFIENLKEINEDFYGYVAAVKKIVEASAIPSKVAALEELKNLGLINEFRK